MLRALSIAVMLSSSFCGLTYAEELSRFTGVWQLNKTISTDVYAAIDECTSTMNFFTRSIARRRLTETNTPHNSIMIAVDAMNIHIKYGNRSVKAPKDGAYVSWQREDGEIFDVSHRYQDDALVAIFKSDEGNKTIFFTLSDHSPMLVQNVVVSSQKLPKPLKYRLAYKRVNN